MTDKQCLGQLTIHSIVLKRILLGRHPQLSVFCSLRLQSALRCRDGAPNRVALLIFLVFIGTNLSARGSVPFTEINLSAASVFNTTMVHQLLNCQSSETHDFYWIFDCVNPGFVSWGHLHARNKNHACAFHPHDIRATIARPNHFFKGCRRMLLYC